MNAQYDLARPLASALRAKSPYVGLPMPGHAPLIFKRSLLVGALRGVKPVNIEVETLDNGARYLVIDSVASTRCRSRSRFVSIPRQRFKMWGTPEAKAMDKWSAKGKPVTTPKNTKHATAIAKLEKQLAKLGARPTIFNIATATGYRHVLDRQIWQDWYAQKSLRGKIGALGAQVREGKITSRELYTALDALPGIGEVKRFSDLTAYTRRRNGINSKTSIRHAERNGFFDYADPKILWTFTGMASHYGGGRPDLYGDAWDDPTRWGATRYAPVLEWSRERAELLSQIEAVKAMIAT